MAGRRADQAGFLPGTAANADIDAANPPGSRPGQAADRQVSRLDRLAGLGLGDQGTHALQTDRLLYHPAVSLPLVDIPLGLEDAFERLIDGLDRGQQFDGGHAVPARDDDPQRKAVPERERLAI